MTTSPNCLIAAMEALLEGARRGANDTLLLAPEAVEHRVARQAHLVRQCHAALPQMMHTADRDERARIASLARSVRHSMNVYRLVLQSGLRCTSARLRSSSGAREDEPGV